MSKEEDLEYVDYDSRAREIIRDLSNDGYPDDAQLTIIAGTLTILLADSADNAEHLAEGVALAKRMIDQGTRMWFEQRKGAP